MSQRSARRTVAAILASGAVIGSGLGIVQAAQATTLSTCHLVADVPNSNNNATVGRLGCTNSESWTGYVKHDYSFSPDHVVGSVSGTGNGTKVADGNCKDGNGNYYSQTESSSGAIYRSAEANRC